MQSSMEKKSWKPILNICPTHTEDSRFHQAELMTLKKGNTSCSCRTALPIPGKFPHMWQVNQTEKTLLINYHLVGPRYQITFNLQARPVQGMDFSPLSVLWMMICWLSLISAGMEEEAGGGGKALLPPGFLLVGRNPLWGGPKSLHSGKENGWKGIAALHIASAVLHGGKTPSIQIPKMQISAKYHLKMLRGWELAPH